MRRLACLLGLLMATALLAACGGNDEEAAAPAPDEPTQLDVKVTGAASEPIRMTLRCGGTCDVAKADEAIKGANDPARACTQQYGGPAEAHITGTIEGRPVDTTLTRNDGCAIHAYDTFFAAFDRKPPVGG